MKLSKAEHNKRHKELHRALDELVADWISETKCFPSENTVLSLMMWASKQFKDQPRKDKLMSKRAFVVEVDGEWQVKFIDTKTGHTKLQDVFNNREDACAKAKLSNYIYAKCEKYCKEYQHSR